MSQRSPRIQRGVIFLRKGKSRVAGAEGVTQDRTTLTNSGKTMLETGFLSWKDGLIGWIYAEEGCPTVVHS